MVPWDSLIHKQLNVQVSCSEKLLMPFVLLTRIFDLKHTLCCVYLGQFILFTEHRASAHHQTEGDPSGGVKSLHEGS